MSTETTETKVIFKHEEKDFLKACGTTEEGFRALIEKANALAKPIFEEENSSLSRVVEEYSNNLTKLELALLLYHTQDGLGSLRGQVEELFGSSNSFKEE